MGPPPPAGSRPTVLVCDDEPVLRMLVRATLDQGNYTVVEACDGDEALERSRSEHPDLILLDMMMPGHSGSDVLRELRADPATAATPVIMLTARAQASDREAMNVAGADHYLTKPFSPVGLAALVGEVLGTCGRRSFDRVGRVDGPARDVIKCPAADAVFRN